MDDENVNMAQSADNKKLSGPTVIRKPEPVKVNLYKLYKKKVCKKKVSEKVSEKVSKKSFRKGF